MATEHTTKFLYISLALNGIFVFYLVYQSKFSIQDIKEQYLMFSTESTRGYNKTVSKSKSIKMNIPTVTSRIKWNTQCNGHNIYALIVNIRNRLGNNMFQFASSIGIAYRNGLVPVYPRQWSPVFKAFNLTMDIHKSLPDSCKKYKTFNYTQHNHANMYDQHTEALGYISHHRKSNIYLDGFWENEKYFTNIKSEIRQQFQFTDAIKREAEEFLNEQMTKRFDGKEFVKVGVHLRLGDRRKEWEEIGKKYIQKAISFYQHQYVNLLFVVCSDDISAARKMFPKNTNVIYSEKFRDKPWVDLAILTLCDHSIITVGTFSWWTGWLTGGKVVYIHESFKLRKNKMSDAHYKIMREYHLDWVPL